MAKEHPSEQQLVLMKRELSSWWVVSFVDRAGRTVLKFTPPDGVQFQEPFEIRLTEPKS